MAKIRFPEAKPVTVKRLVVIHDELGGEIEDWQGTSVMQAEIWPLRGDFKRGEMGVTERSTHRAFSSEAFESNTRLVDDSCTYLVGYVQDWGSHREAILERLEVVLDGGKD